MINAVMLLQNACWQLVHVGEWDCMYCLQLATKCLQLAGELHLVAQLVMAVWHETMRAVHMSARVYCT